MRIVAILSALTLIWSLILLAFTSLFPELPSPYTLLLTATSSLILLIIIYPHLPDRPPDEDERQP